MTIQISTLRVTAELDASKYEQAARMKAEADRLMTQSAKGLDAALAGTEERVKKVGSFTPYLRSYVDGYAAVSDFTRGLRNLDAQLAVGKTTAEIAVQVYAGLAARFGVSAEAARQAATQFAALNGVVAQNGQSIGTRFTELERRGSAMAQGLTTAAAAQREFATQVAAVDRALRQQEQAEQRRIDILWKEVDATQAVIQAERERYNAMAAQAAFNSKLGVGASSGGSAAASAEVFLEDERRALAAQKYRDAINPLLAIQRTYAAQVAEINGLHVAGKLTDNERLSLLMRERQLLDERTRALAQSATVERGTRATSGLTGILGSASTAVQTFAGSFAGTFAAQAVWGVFNTIRELPGDLVRAADMVKMLQGRFDALTGSAAAGQAAVAGIFDIAGRLGGRVEDTAKAFTRFQIGGGDVGFVTSEMLRLTETVQKLGIIGGANVQELSAGLVQLGQAVASGVLRGDEFRSMMENLPLVARRLADGLNVTVGELRAMAEAGELTAERVVNALAGAAQRTDQEFKRIPVTVERASNMAIVGFTQLAYAVDNSIGLSRALSSVLQGVADAARVAALRIEGDLVQRIKDLGAEVQRLERQTTRQMPGALPPPGQQTPEQRTGLRLPSPARPGAPDLAQPQQLDTARQRLERETNQAIFAIEAAAAAGGVAAEKWAALYVAATNKMNAGLKIMHEELGLVAKEGRLVTKEQDQLEKATAAVDEAVRRGGHALRLYGGDADQARAMLQRFREAVDPLQKALKGLRDEAALLAVPEGFERDIARALQAFEADAKRPATIDERLELRLGVFNRNTAGTVDAAEMARREAVAQDRLAKAAGGSNAAMREAERINALVAAGYKVLTAEQARHLEKTGQLPPMADGASTALRDLDRQLRAKGAADGAREMREWGAAAHAVVTGARLAAEAAGLGEAAERAAAAQAAISAERNNKAGEASKQRALEDAKVLQITNELTRGYARSANDNDLMTAAIYRGVEAIEAEIEAQQRREIARRLGPLGDVDGVMAKWKTQRQSDTDKAAAEQWRVIDEEAKATIRLAEATKLGAAAVAEAEVQNRLLAEADKRRLGSVEELEQKYPLLAKAIRDSAAATKELAIQQALAQQQMDIRGGQADLGFGFSIRPEDRQHELALIRARLDLERQGVDASSRQGQEYLRNAALIADINDLLRVRNAIEDKAREISKDVTDFLVDGFANVENKGKSVFENIWDGALAGARRFAIRLAATFLEQQIILPITMQVVGGMPELFGIRPAAGNRLAGASGGSGGFNIGDLLGIGKLFGGNEGFLGLPTFRQGWSALFGTGANAALSSAASVGTMAGAGGLAAAESAGISAMMAGGSIEAAAAASTAAGAGVAGVGTLASLASVALPIAAIAVPLILGGLFKSKPSNKGAEFSVWTDQDFSTQFQSAKHTDQDAFVRQFAEPLRALVTNAERRFGVERQSDATVGAIYGVKEGSLFYYDRGPRDGGAENRQKFSFDPDDQSSIQGALDSMMVAFLKDADWSGVGERLGAQVGADVSTALENSAATSLQDLIADIDFAKGFDDLVKLGESGLDPVALALKKLGDAGREGAASIATAVDTFRTRAQDLGLGTDVLATGLTRVDEGTQGLILAMLGLEAEMDPLAAATAQANAFIADLRPILEQAGFSAAEVGDIVNQVFNNMVADAQAAAAQVRQAQIAAEVNSQNLLNQALYGSNYKAPADSFLYGLVGHKYDIPAGGGTFAPLVGALNRARSGDYAGLQEVFSRALANQDKGVFTPEERAAVEQYGFDLFTQWQRNQAAKPSPQAPDPTSGTSGGGANDNDPNREAIDARQKEIDKIREAIDRREDELREAERLAEGFRRAADDIRLFRLGRLTDPARSPLSLEDQLAEAVRQQGDAMARIRAGGPDAIEAYRELQSTTSRIDEIAMLMFGSSKQQVDIFMRNTALLKEAEDRGISFEQQQLAIAEAQRAELVKLNEQMEKLRAEIDGLRNPGTPGSPGSGDPGSPGSPGSPGGAVDPYRFGYANLGRQQGETADAFMKRMFPKEHARLSADGPVSEKEGYDWSQTLRDPGKLIGVTNAGYYAAARRAGYDGVFSDGGHAGYLSPGGTPIYQRWYDFIDELRAIFGKSSVPYGYFGIPYAEGGLITGGVPGRDSVPIIAMPGERMLSVEQNRMFERFASGQNSAAWLRQFDLYRAEQRAFAAANDRNHAMLRAEVQGLRADVRALRGNGPVGTAFGKRAA